MGYTGFSWVDMGLNEFLWVLLGWSVFNWVSSGLLPCFKVDWGVCGIRRVWPVSRAPTQRRAPVAPFSVRFCFAFVSLLFVSLLVVLFCFSLSPFASTLPSRLSIAPFCFVRSRLLVLFCCFYFISFSRVFSLVWTPPPCSALARTSLAQGQRRPHAPTCAKRRRETNADRRLSNPIERLDDAIERLEADRLGRRRLRGLDRPALETRVSRLLFRNQVKRRGYRGKSDGHRRRAKPVNPVKIEATPSKA